VTPEDRGEWCYGHEQVHEFDAYEGTPEAAVCWWAGDPTAGGRAGDEVLQHAGQWIRGDVGEAAVAPPRRSVLDQVKALTVCWWLHRTRRVFPGVYVSTSCRACARKGR
jgi:hypothetical protein